MTRWIPSVEHTNLGAILVKMGVCTEEQTKEVAQEQSKQTNGHRLKFGELAVKMGVVEPIKLKTALEFQQRMRDGSAVEVMCEIVNHRQERALTPRPLVA